MTIYVPFCEKMKVMITGSRGNFGCSLTGEFIVSEAIKIHLTDILINHIAGFYLCYINNDGLYLEGGISQNIGDVHLDIRLDDRAQLKIIGIDME